MNPSIQFEQAYEQLFAGTKKRLDELMNCDENWLKNSARFDWTLGTELLAFEKQFGVTSKVAERLAADLARDFEGLPFDAAHIEKSKTFAQAHPTREELESFLNDLDAHVRVIMSKSALTLNPESFEETYRAFIELLQVRMIVLIDLVETPGGERAAAEFSYYMGADFLALEEAFDLDDAALERLNNAFKDALKKGGLLDIFGDDFDLDACADLASAYPDFESFWQDYQASDGCQADNCCGTGECMENGDDSQS